MSATLTNLKDGGSQIHLPKGTIKVVPGEMSLKPDEQVKVVPLDLREQNQHWPVARGFGSKETYKSELRSLCSFLGVEGVFFKGKVSEVNRDLFPFGGLRIFTSPERIKSPNSCWEWVPPEQGKAFRISQFRGKLREWVVSDWDAVTRGLLAIPIRVYEEEPQFGSIYECTWGFIESRKVHSLWAENPEVTSYFDTYRIVKGEWRSSRKKDPLAALRGARPSKEEVKPLPLWIPSYPELSRDKVEIEW